MSLTYPVRPGDRIAGKYLIEHRLGRGASGLLFAAKHELLNQQVAIKFLRPELARRPENGFRFRQQARAAAGIEGERICRVLDVGSLEGGIPYVVMEYLEGYDLASELAANGGKRPFAEAVEWVIFAAEGLAEALAAGVVHADLEPSKLYWAESPGGSRQLKLLGLGAAASEPLTVPHWVNTRAEPLLSERELRYLAPEQRKSSVVVDSCSNVWTLGAILLELLTGRPISELQLTARRSARSGSAAELFSDATARRSARARANDARAASAQRSWSRSARIEALDTGERSGSADPRERSRSSLTHPKRSTSSGATSEFARILDELDVHLPDGLAEVLACALAPSRADRYANVVDFARALAPFASLEAQAAVERITRLVPAAPDPQHGLFRVVRRRALLAAAGVAALGLAIHLLAHAGASSRNRSDPRSFSADPQLLELAKKLRTDTISRVETKPIGAAGQPPTFTLAGSPGAANLSSAGSRSETRAFLPERPLAQLQSATAGSLSSSGGANPLLPPRPSTMTSTRAVERPTSNPHHISDFGGRR